MGGGCCRGGGSQSTTVCLLNVLQIFIFIQSLFRVFSFFFLFTKIIVRLLLFKQNITQYEINHGVRIGFEIPIFFFSDVKVILFTVNNVEELLDFFCERVPFSRFCCIQRLFHLFKDFSEDARLSDPECKQTWFNQCMQTWFDQCKQTWFDQCKQTWFDHPS